jgi:hypothetical protein
MNKINPLYILGFFTLALILIIYKTSVMQEKISIVTQKNVQIEEDGKQIQLLKKRWKNQKLMTQRLKKILNHKSFAKKVTKKEKKRNIYSIKLENLDYRTLDSFTNKILNEAIIIKKMTIERFSENNASVSLECSL